VRGLSQEKLAAIRSYKEFLAEVEATGTGT
jgi:hypothetical protein